MNMTANRSLQVKCLDKEAFNLHSVISDPRAARPLDVKAACDNIVIECQDKKPALDVMSLIGFLFGGFFQLAHSSGLYNRQKDLWESLAKVTSIKVEVVRSSNYIVPFRLPVFNLEFMNSRGELIIMARLVKAQKRKDFDRRAMGYLKSFLKKVSKTKLKKHTLSGAFICLPNPISENIIYQVEKLVGRDDSIARFESRLPPPTDIAFDVLEMNNTEPNSALFEDETNGSENARLLYPEKQLLKVSLAHPRLQKKR